VASIISNTDSINTVSENTAAVSVSTHQQNEATREIAQNVKQAAASTQNITSNIVGVTRVAVETGDVAGQILSAVGDLSHQSETLNTEVEKFLSQVRH